MSVTYSELLQLVCRGNHKVNGPACEKTCGVVVNAVIRLIGLANERYIFELNSSKMRERVLRDALTNIRDWSRCQCTCDDENCCSVVGEECDGCEAKAALKTLAPLA